MLPSPRRAARVRRLIAAAAATATACSLALVPLAAQAAIVDDRVSDSAADAPFTIDPAGTFETGLFDQGASEIVQAHGDRLFSVNAAAGTVFVVDMTDPAELTELFQIGAEGAVANSVAIREDGLGAVALEDAADKTAAGRVLFFDADADSAEDAVLGTVTVGSLPDMVTISPDGAYAVVADEGEPADDFSTDPEGTVSVIELPDSVAAPAQRAVATADFHAFEGDALPAGVRVSGPRPHGDDLPVSRNLEPEYIAVAGSTAYAALQEANSVAVVDLPTATVTDILPLGTKNWGATGLDASDRDPEGAPTIDIAEYPGLRGMYMPDGIQAYEANGQTFLVTANEGDAREWGDYTDAARVADLEQDGQGPLCDDIAAYAQDDTLGRLEVSIEDGFDGECYEELYAYGARSFSIWTANGDLVFDSGSQFEKLTAELVPDHFNAGHDDNAFDSRSDAKGVEPENLAIGEIDGRTYAFIGLERLSGIMTYDITDPAAPSYVAYVDNRDFDVDLGAEVEALEEAGASEAEIAEVIASAGDLGPEGLDFIAATDSPTGKPMLAVGNEVTGTTTLWAIDDGTTEVQVLTINDFHGRISAGGDEAGAAVLAGAVAQYRDANPNTVFASAGDNIGASTFTSFIDDDNPTIDALSLAGLDVGAVGNHEFDQGFDDLTDRVIPRFADKTGLNGGDFALGANVYRKGTTDPALQEYAIREVGGVKVGFVGTVTSDTATLVSPAGIADIEFGDQLEAANRVAAELTASGEADVVVLLTHSGSAGEDCDALAAEQSEYGDLVRGASDDIDAIVSGHTHQLYDCEVDGRPVIQAHQYGTTLGALDIVTDSETNELISIAGSTVDLVDDSGDEPLPLFPADPRVAQLVADAEAEAEVLGAEPVGRISADILRGGTPPGDDRGVESTMGNLVADVYLWSASEYDSYGGSDPAQVAIMNPGGLRDDLLFQGDGTVTYADVAAVQPFGNTLVTLTLTGAQLEQVLEEQWQPGAERPKLHLGVSEGFEYEYVEDAADGEHIVSMSYLGEPVEAEDELLIVTNSFLAAGGDGFTTLAEGTGTADSGLIDLAATVDYFAEREVVDPAPLGRAIVWSEEQPTPAPSPTPTPTPTDDGPWVEISLGSAEVEQGDTLDVVLTGLQPGQAVGATLHSEPIVVEGLPAADEDGEIAFSIGIPADFEVGPHTLEITSAELDPVTAELTVVAAAPLAATGGGTPWGLAVGAAGLMAAGGLLLALRRRGASVRHR
ncbi:choice-of-anchor I family protein [Microbacterium marinilacus]|uniref:Bifunctional metallophosphatase/5'-nucleotidase n=1 Tax=Microbacterium marinilacus TaxID=415209 RepID=A0ABP7BKR7_9MICO|nr:choice-of-anchor I family protein [Microbacterium marinilacus]MBY0689731.1 bifunctional metallophosphatase/5'-nucleotidase [Microbacterium marinilacus]